jgi:hypothetical protein
MNIPALDRKHRLLNVIDSVLELLEEGEVEAYGEHTTNSTSTRPVQK